MPFNIPTIDIGQSFSSDSVYAESQANLLREILIEYGFFSVNNHNIDTKIIKTIESKAKEFFSCSPEQKNLCIGYLESTGSTRFIPGNSHMQNLRIVPDHFFSNNHKLLQYENRRLESVGKTIDDYMLLPKDDIVDGFESATRSYINAMSSVANKLLPLYARALNLEYNYFNNLFTDPYWIFYCKYYPPYSTLENQYGLAEHSDLDFITILPLSSVPGLEILVENSWQPVGYKENSILVFTGDFLHRWSNGLCKAAVHRVTIPETDRYSFPFHYNPNFDVTDESLPSCINENPIVDSPLTLFDFLHKRTLL